MKPRLPRPWWLRKRMLFPLVLVIGVGITGLIAYEDSDASTIVIYNLTGTPLPPLLVRACEQSQTVSPLAEQESVRIQLKSGGSESVIHLELATEPPWQWDGSLIKPHGGYRVTIRLWPGGQAEAFTDYSWWQKIFN